MDDQTIDQVDEGIEEEATPLDLSRSTLKRERVRIRTSQNPDGEVYELKRPDEFGETELHEITFQMERLDKLWEIEKPDPTQVKQRARLLNQIVGAIIPDAPPADIASGIPTINKRGVAASFFFQGATATARVMGVPVEALMKALETES